MPGSNCSSARLQLTNRICDNGDVARNEAQEAVQRLRSGKLVRKVLAAALEQRQRGPELLSVVRARAVRRDAVEGRRPVQLREASPPVDVDALAASCAVFQQQAALTAAAERRLGGLEAVTTLSLCVGVDGVVMPTIDVIESEKNSKPGANLRSRQKQ